ncbi:hypothetical protein ACYUJ6_12240 [Clostridium sp. JNZ X4-2]
MLKWLKELANDSSDKSVKLAANQYVMNRVYGSPASVIETYNDGNEDDINEKKQIQIFTIYIYTVFYAFVYKNKLSC